jgi:hypothetical protein
MVPVKLDEAEKEHLGSLYSVDIANTNGPTGNRQTMFELAVNKDIIPSTYGIIKKLWDCGYFFSPWTNAYILNNPTSPCVRIFDPDLLNGAVSINSSTKIINKLKNISKVVCR